MIRVISAAAIFATSVTLTGAVGAYAQMFQPANDVTDRMRNQPQVLLAPPPGDGQVAPLEIPGDMGVNPPVPSNPVIVDAPETPFEARKKAVGTGFERSVVRLIGTDHNDGSTVVLQTLRMDTLTKDQSQAVQGLFPAIFAQRGQPVIDVANVTDAQMALLNQILFPYPRYVTSANQARLAQISGNPDWKQVVADNAPPTTRVFILPKVHEFCRYLVILGVVCSTIFMILAATGYMFGHREADARVIGAIAGLMVLLMAFTIWKIVMRNSLGSE
ncbi:MAG: hypothetical protein ACRD3W_26805, partial [Terriglobales bacterium]